MATNDPLMPLSENVKTPQIYQLEGGQNEARYTKESDNVNVQPPEKFIGLTKEQLEEYRNDPFWKPIRMIMFALFWLIWIAMFAGAIVIVVLSPKCIPKSEPKWWEAKVSYQMFTPAFKDSNGDGIGDISGIYDKLENIRKLGIQTIWPTPLIETDDLQIYDVTNFEKIDSRLGTIDDFKQLVDQVHDNGMYIVMDLPISTTSTKHQWFQSALSGDSTFKDYYIWMNTLNDKEYWTKPTGINESYMHYREKPELPILNWANDNVVNHIINAAKYWLDLGVDGLHVEYVDYLSRTGLYASLDWTEAINRLANFERAISEHLNASENLRDKFIILFSTVRDVSGRDRLRLIDESKFNYLINQELANCGVDMVPDGVDMVQCFHSKLNETLNEYDKTPEIHPLWELSNPHTPRLANRVGNDVDIAQLITFVHLLLPGAVKFYYGDAIGMVDNPNVTNGVQRGLMQWDNSPNGGFSTKEDGLFAPPSGNYAQINFQEQYDKSPSPVKTFMKLAQLRKREEVLIRGGMRIGQLYEKAAFAFSRAAFNGTETTGPVYIGVVNFGSSAMTFDLMKNESELFSPKPASSLANAQIVAVTANIEDRLPRQSIDLTKTLDLNAKSGLLFRIN